MSHEPTCLGPVARQFRDGPGWVPRLQASVLDLRVFRPRMPGSRVTADDA